MSSDDIEWEEPLVIGEIEWEVRQPPKPTPAIVRKANEFIHSVRNFKPNRITTFLVICLIIMTSIAVVESQHIVILNNEITNLNNEIEELQEDYIELFSDYSNLEAVFEEPLTDPEIPTYYELRNWLAQDDTDQNEYVEGVWNCGDFAAMLMTRAKEMNWRVRIAVIGYSLQGEVGYGSTTHYGAHGHTFNMIECTDGVWYIEPQTDGTWYIVTGITQERTEFFGYTYYNFIDSTSDTIWDGYRWWTNYYGQFA